MTDRNRRTIFSSEPVQVLQVHSRGSPLKRSSPMAYQGSCSVLHPSPSSYELLFGSSRNGRHQMDTTQHEMSRLEIVTVRQLQRALQNKITQNTRNPMGLWSAFNKLDRRGVQHLNLADLIAAVRGFNLVASDELVTQLLHALDRDHDGVLSLSEFVAGLKESGSSAMQLHEPDNSVSSRRYFRGLNFHHPLHNVAHLSTLHQFGDM